MASTLPCTQQNPLILLPLHIQLLASPGVLARVMKVLIPLGLAWV